jgi:hypothetical protein
MQDFSYEGHFTSLTQVGLVPEGLRLDVAFEAKVTEGPATGGTVTGIDYVVLRPDGVGVLDVRSLVRTPSGTTISGQARGYLTSPAAMPPLAALLAPDFEWPDVDFNLHGAITLRTMDPALAAVNHTMYGYTGTANVARNELKVRSRSLALVPVG